MAHVSAVLHIFEGDVTNVSTMRGSRTAGEPVVGNSLNCIVAAGIRAAIGCGMVGGDTVEVRIDVLQQKDE